MAQPSETTKDKITVVQCWDDGVTSDVRLVDILRRHGATATFNLCAGLHENESRSAWIHEGTEVRRLGWQDMRSTYEGFTIANHSLTHPALDQLNAETARREIGEGRERLRQFFGQPVFGFAYPFGAYNQTVMRLVHEAGHVYARTTGEAQDPFPPENPMAFHPSCHVLAPDLWARYERTTPGGVFYFWGHSYEFVTETMWQDFEQVIARISADLRARWADVADLFAVTGGG